MIIDAHTHFYDPSRPQGVPWPGPKSGSIYRTVLPEHHREVAAASGVTGTIVVEASAWLEDNQWILDLAERDPWIVGLVGHIETDEQFSANIDRFAANPVFCGIRTGPGFIDNSDGRALERAEKMAQHNLAVEFHIPPEQLGTLAELAGRVPELKWVMGHCGEPKLDGQPPQADWIDYINSAAALPQVYCKVSGLVEYCVQKPAPADIGFYEAMLDVLWEAYGEDRIIYGSNWPVCDLSSDHETVIAIVRTYLEGKGADMGKYWHENAKKAYGCVDR